MKKFLALLSLAVFSVTVNAQILLSGGLSYSQNFDSLSNSPAAGSATWTDNTTLLGWYASKGLPSLATYTTYRIGDGSANNGSIWSLGTIGNTDRALGSIGSGTPKTNSIGLRIQNDTGSIMTNILISYTGEEWRNGGNVVTQFLYFSYSITNGAFGGPITAVTNDLNYIVFPTLNFASPTVGATATALDGNNATNRTALSAELTGVTLAPGSEILLRWTDADDNSNDHGLAVDDFSVSFTALAPVPEPSTMALAALGGLGFVMLRRRR